ncbi:hypothetical protein MIMGU_mgv11b022721mg [Erythranthe guttata]|uniref:Uncharacterized protein n=1 Tax=Erythranthe guttata TaxID=4155 RepID=A0A022RU29_ERYGU|nr:hypothetical protein MIMGU_mgv11b022721mg [Erythranthe guttata]
MYYSIQFLVILIVKEFFGRSTNLPKIFVIYIQFLLIFIVKKFFGCSTNFIQNLCTMAYNFCINILVILIVKEFFGRSTNFTQNICTIIFCFLDIPSFFFPKSVYYIIYTFYLF